MYKLLNRKLIASCIAINLNCYSIGATAVEIDNVLHDIEQCSPELIDKNSDVASAISRLEKEEAKRLPSFSLSANASKFTEESSTNDDSSLDFEASYVLYSFGKFDANESIAKQSIQNEIALEKQMTLSELSSLFEKKILLEKLFNDMITVEKYIAKQQAVFDRVKRRAKYNFSSDSDENAVFAKLLQNKNKVNNYLMRIDEIQSELNTMACTSLLMSLTYSDAKNSTYWNASDSVSLPLELQIINNQILLKQAEIEVNSLSLRPNLELLGRAPVDEDVSEKSSLGLRMNFTYGNMGYTQSIESDSISKEIESLEKKKNVISEQRAKLITRLITQIDSLSNNVLPSQSLSLEALSKKLESKERLFKAGRVSLFELLSIYDEVLNAELLFNENKSKLMRTKNEISKQFDYKELF
jgi:outer membrane protein TolC